MPLQASIQLTGSTWTCASEIDLILEVSPGKGTNIPFPKVDLQYCPHLRWSVPAVWLHQ